MEVVITMKKIIFVVDLNSVTVNDLCGIERLSPRDEVHILINSGESSYNRNISQLLKSLITKATVIIKPINSDTSIDYESKLCAYFGQLFNIRKSNCTYVLISTNKPIDCLHIAKSIDTFLIDYLQQELDDLEEKLESIGLNTAQRTKIITTMRTCSDRLRLFDTITTITEECPQTSPNDIYRECVATHLIGGTSYAY